MGSGPDHPNKASTAIRGIVIFLLSICKKQTKKATPEKCNKRKHACAVFVQTVLWNMPNIETQSKDALVEAKVRPDHLFSRLPTQDILWVSSSQPGHRISDPHTCFLSARTTRPQWLVSSHGQALSSFPLSDCPSVQRLRLQTSRSTAHGSLWSVHTRPATPQLCWQEHLSKGPWESLSPKEL